MKLRFKHQGFQAEAAEAVCRVFEGQPYKQLDFLADAGVETGSQRMMVYDMRGWCNNPIDERLPLLEQIQKIQKETMIKPSQKLEGKYNLSIEMETGTGKTYTYIKTIFELNKRYGWSKYVIIVPSVAIREGVLKTFQMTREHFMEEYATSLNYFVYDSSRYTEVERFVSSPDIYVMIINSQAFNSDNAIINRKLSAFRNRSHIDMIGATRPILIVDEPQSVEGKQTVEKMKNFRPLMTLRYSATHRKGCEYNMIYRLDALDAYNKRLVKKISVKGFTETGSTATAGYVHLKEIKDLKATVEYEEKGLFDVRRVTKKLSVGNDLYELSGELEQYRDGFIIKTIDGFNNRIEFINGSKLEVGRAIGYIEEEQLRREQIRATIKCHLEKERCLYRKGIKVLSLFFIDEVAKYRKYSDNGQVELGEYAQIFEEEYEKVYNSFQWEFGDEAYQKYLEDIPVNLTHNGYFSQDKKGRMVNSKISRDGKKTRTSDDIDAYDLIMKDKERLLDLNPIKSPVRFIFSHSALREGWDNPNVFQICTLKQSGADVRKRQEVGRGLRLCVNQNGDRMDESVLDDQVQEINHLTVIASESYESFAKALQSEMAEDLENRVLVVKVELFKDRVVKDNEGNKKKITEEEANAIYFDLIREGYIDKKGQLTEKYYQDEAQGNVQVAEEAKEFASAVVEILRSVESGKAYKISNEDDNDVDVRLQRDKLEMKEFKELWSRINAKSVYVVNFDTNELVKNAISRLNKDLRVKIIQFREETGTLGGDKYLSRESLRAGEAFGTKNVQYGDDVTISSGVQYDLVGKIVDETDLTRRAVIDILKGIEPLVFEQFKKNPEDFIVRASSLINEEKAGAVIQHISYNKLEDWHKTDIFTESSVKGKLNINVLRTKKHLYDHLQYDSKNERAFAEELDSNEAVAIYVKLPRGFYISTPVGKYNPDWAIAFYEGQVKHIFFIAETKGSMNTLQLRGIEEAKIHCAREHFKAISTENIVYDVVDCFSSLWQLIKK